MKITGNNYSLFQQSMTRKSKKYQSVYNENMNFIIAEEMKMTPEQKLMYELFGGREQAIKNRMKLYDSDGNMLNSRGVAGMCMNGVSLEEAHQIIDVPKQWRQKMFDETKRHFIQEYGVANGNTTKRSDVFEGYQRSTDIEDRLRGTWTLGQYEKAYRRAFYNAVKAEDPNWELGKPFSPSILNKISREDIDNSLVEVEGPYGAELVSKGLDIKV